MVYMVYHGKSLYYIFKGCRPPAADPRGVGRREIAAVTEQRLKTSPQATLGATGEATAAADFDSEGPARAASGVNAAHEVPPACGPQTNTDATFYYTCPFCEATVSSSVRSGQVNHRRHCGNRFRVKDGCVAGKKRVYQCPFCAGEVSSNVMTGQINHRSVCGNQFYVFLCKDRQSQRCDAKTYAHMPAVPSDRVVGMRLRPNPRAAHHTSGTPVRTEELDEPRKERSIGNQRLSDASRKSAGQRPADGQGRREAFKARLLPNVAF